MAVEAMDEHIGEKGSDTEARAYPKEGTRAKARVGLAWALDCVDNSEEQRDYVILKTDMIRGNDGQVMITVESEIVLESATLGNGASFPLHLYGIGDAGGARPL